MGYQGNKSRLDRWRGVQFGKGSFCEDFNNLLELLEVDCGLKLVRRPALGDYVNRYGEPSLGYEANYGRDRVLNGVKYSFRLDLVLDVNGLTGHFWCNTTKGNVFTKRFNGFNDVGVLYSMLAEHLVKSNSDRDRVADLRKPKRKGLILDDFS